MRILIVTFAFPPYNAIGAVRVGKAAKYLRNAGHDVRVLTSRNQPWPATLPLEIPGDLVVATPWLNVNRLAELAAGGRDRVAAQGFEAGAGRQGLKARLGRAYKALLNVPDGQVGWLWPAVRGGARLLSHWRPDVILASSPPPTGLLVAARLAARFGIPWVADLRDLWTDSPYYDFGPRRGALERRLEARVLGSAAGLVTVSEPLRETLASRFGVPTATVHNGFDPGDYPADAAPPPGGPLRIVYTGMLYGNRDPTPLFRAIGMLADPAAVRVLFYGRYLSAAAAAARACGVEDQVEVHPAVPYHESLRLQRTADALLLLPGNDPAAHGVFTGKFFEYLGARRPLVVVSDRRNVAAAVVASRELGIVDTDPGALAAGLARWVAEKRQGRPPADLPDAPVREFTREGQTARLAEFLERVVAA
jgi:glycosyltransferase involved in cell wall biosynthesis